MFAHAALLPHPPRLHRRALALYDGVIRGTYGARRNCAHQTKIAFQSKQLMTSSQDRTDAAPGDDAPQGIEGVLLANRDRIVRFLQVRGAGDAAEDLFQDLWMRLTDRPIGPIADPLPYVMRAANNLMLDRYRSARQSELRDKAWGEAAAGHHPSAETSLSLASNCGWSRRRLPRPATAPPASFAGSASMGLANAI